MMGDKLPWVVTSKGYAHHPSCRDGRERLVHPTVTMVFDGADPPDGVKIAKCCRNQAGRYR